MDYNRMWRKLSEQLVEKIKKSDCTYFVSEVTTLSDVVCMMNDILMEEIDGKDEE